MVFFINLHGINIITSYILVINYVGTYTLLYKQFNKAYFNGL